jgi:hypothetical protein
MIYDHDNRPLLSTTMSIGSETDLQFKIYIDCRAGYFLRATSVDTLTVSGRPQGVSGPFTNLETSAIDLTPYNGTRKEFSIKVDSASFTTYGRRSFFLEVSP